MAYDIKKFNQWQKQFPNATEKEVEMAKSLYEITDDVKAAAKTSPTAPAAE